jgi:hypothetical protein
MHLCKGTGTLVPRVRPYADAQRRPVHTRTAYTAHARVQSFAYVKPSDRVC